MERVCYFNGQIMPESEAKIGVHDLGVLRGFGIYEALRTFDRKLFMFVKHMERFRASAAAMTLEVPASNEEISTIVGTLVAQNVAEGKEARAKLILTGGESENGLDLGPTPTFYILVEEFTALPSAVYEKGCSLIVHEYQRAFAENKTTSYAQAVVLQKARKEAGALEILYTSQGNVLECSTSNIFVVKEGRVATPKKGVLEGITRNIVIDLAQKEFPVEERDLSVEELYSADEVFITATFKNVVPVVEIAGKKIGPGMPGTVSKRLGELLEEFEKEGSWT